MGIAKVGSKKKVAQKFRVIDGKRIKPCMYYGRDVGHGNYLAAMDASTDQLVIDPVTGAPFHFRSGDLVSEVATA